MSLVGSQIVVRCFFYVFACYPDFVIVMDVVCRSVDEAADRAYDYVLLTTKAIPDIIKTSQILLPLLSSPYTDTFHQPAYLVLQNGLNVEADLYNAVKSLGKGEPKVIGSSLYIATNLVAPDVVEHSGLVSSFISPSPQLTPLAWTVSANSRNIPTE